ncbi:hypothetical protein PPYR_00917 [Photinus pyralis]|uniref:Peptidase M13 N-terminal domain-containing protein n=1 Tax=Photinus pyralis TaxID=7054 RepID=A0A5N4B2W7_PHOPY|nr:neprilysin-2-like [Photinus pyralis]KAB0803947.1 hypothetical protein PPYR_00917 [Photinus pyralis]
MPERKSNKYKLLLYILPLGLVLMVLSIVASRLAHEHPTCQTQLCISAAHEIISSIDPKVDPCEDFLTFACGNAIRKGRERKLVKIKQEIKTDLDTLMEGRVGADDNVSVKRQKNLFQVCMNETGSEEESLDAFRMLLSNFNGWPVVVGDHWDGKSFDWISTTYKLRAYGLLYVSFLDFGIDPDPVNGSRYLLHIKEPFVVAPEEEHKISYVNFMIASVVTFGANRALAKKEMSEVYEFTTKLYHVTTENDWDTIDDIKDSRHSVKDFQAKSNRTDWLKLIRQIVELGEDDHVLFPKPKFVNALFNLLNSTPRRVQANYLFWNLYESLVHFFPQRFRQLEQNYNCQTAPSTVPKTRADFCRRIVQLSFDVIPTDMLYAKQKMTGELKSSVEEMVKNIKVEIIALLEHSGWMDEISVDMAVRKVNAVTSVIGLSEDLDIVNQRYSNSTLQVNGDSGCLLNVYLESRRALTDTMYARINTFTYNHELDKFANSVNAAYLPELNIIVLHAGILHDDIFHPHQKSYRNYGMLGSIIGHELAHAISDGSLWTNETKSSYERVAKCFLDQVDNFKLQGTTFQMNGTRTLEENIADAVGVKASFNAYRKWVIKHGNERRLVGLDYTPDQLFWISAVSQYCYKLSDKQLGQVLNRDNHALNIFRAVNPLRNNKDFASAFKCSLGSKMNPNVQCKVYG